MSTPHGASIPLGQIATVKLEEGPSVIYREDGQRYAPVKFSVRGRDLESTIKVFLVRGAVRTWIDTLMVIISIPVACTGGVLALLLAVIHFSVSAAMGFSSIFGWPSRTRS